MSSILDDIKTSFKHGNALTRIIYINLAVFLVMKIVPSLSSLFIRPGIRIDRWFSLPADLGSLLFKPWTIVSYMFLHVDFFHILFNLLWLYFLGKIFLDLLGEKRFISTYLLGGMAGGLLYILAYNIFPVFSDVLPFATAMGASASVMAIIVAIATKVPNYTIRLILLGEVKLKYIAIVFVAMDLISMSDGNAGGHLAHIGGALFGFTYIRSMDRGVDWSATFYKWIAIFQSLFKTNKPGKMHVAHKGKGTPSSAKRKGHSDQEMVDVILDKISKSGYDSLSAEEKSILFKASQNN
ncbi:MAG: rhomboid family intramembrane serine protease [Vicingaceae bacterium]